MLKITIDGQPCVALTEEIAGALSALGEDVSQLNQLSWPVGASNPARGVFLLHSDQAVALAAGNRARPIPVVFVDDTLPDAVGRFTVPMYQIEHRPVHISTVGAVYPGLYAVTLVDARYFWQGVLTTLSFDVTTSADRTAYYDETKNTGAAWTWPGIIGQLAGLLGVTIDTSQVTGIAGDPVDFLWTYEPIPLALDRICATLGMVFSVGIDGTFAVVPPASLNAYAFQHTTMFLRERMAGGVIRNAWNTDGVAWLNTVMPTAVIVRFPRQIPGGPDAHDAANPAPLRQYFLASSTVGKPAGTTGRSGLTVTVNDTLWAVGAVGAETNLTALRARADAVATAYYARYALTLHNVRLMGFLNLGPIAGTVSWRLTAGGPFTELHTTDMLDGGTRDVGEGFNRKNVVGLGGIQTHRTFDGSLVISSDPAPQLATITGYTGAGPVSWGPYQVTFPNGATGNAYNGFEPVNGTPGTLGVNVGTDGSVTGTACFVKPIGNAQVLVTWDAANSRLAFSAPNSAGA